MTRERYVYDKVYKDYGKIILTVNNVLKKKNMSVYRLSRLTGINWGIVQKYVDGKLYRVDLDLLSRMCFALDCSLEELLHYEGIKDKHQNKRNKKRKNKTLIRWININTWLSMSYVIHI